VKPARSAAIGLQGKGASELSQTDSLTDRTARAAHWRFAGLGIGAVSQFGLGVLLARLLTPADFGLMTLAFTVLGLAQPLGDLGIGNAVVQRAELSDRHVRTAFTFSVLLGLAITAVIWLLAPLGAVLMRDAKVTSILRGLAAAFAIGGTAVVAGALLRRQLDFKRRFFVDFGSHVLGYGGVAVTLALTGHGVWSLVWGNLIQTLLASCAALVVVRHSVRPLLGRRELNELLHFGFGSALNACVNYVARNADNVVVGRWIGAGGLGLYSRAYNLMNLPHTFAAGAMSSVLFPAFAQAQHDQVRVRRAFLLITKLTAMVAGPAMGTMAIVAPSLVSSLYGPRWAGAVLPLQILCLAGYFRALYHLGGVVAQSVGRVYAELRNEAVYAVLVIGGSFLGLRHGLPGVAVGVSVAILCMFVVTAQLVLRATGASLGAYVRVQIGALVCTGITCVVALSFRILLEAWHAPTLLLTILVLVAAAIPWGAGMLWTLGEPDLEPLRSRVPRWCVRLAGAIPWGPFGSQGESGVA
jgi:O-antigen/teichoic acid export membrane protein